MPQRTSMMSHRTSVTPYRMSVTPQRTCAMPQRTFVTPSVRKFVTPGRTSKPCSTAAVDDAFITIINNMSVFFVLSLSAFLSTFCNGSNAEIRLVATAYSLTRWRGDTTDWAMNSRCRIIAYRHFSYCLDLCYVMPTLLQTS